MPIADLPYRIERLRKEGQYAYLTRPAVRKVATPSEETEPTEGKKKKTKSHVPTRVRVLRNVNLCDGPSLWLSIETKRSKEELTEGFTPPESYGFYVALRLFATRSMVLDYLSGPELRSYCASTNTPLPELKDEDPVITEENYLDELSVSITKQEYLRTLNVQDETLDDLEEMVCQLRGIDSLESLDRPKRTRRKKEEEVPVEVAPPPPAQIVMPELSDADEAGEAPITLTTASERPSVPDDQRSKTQAPKKRKKATLRDQFVAVQNTPSRVIDVSTFGTSMQHQRGKVLDRIKHGERIAQCVSLPDLFPVISDNVPAFVRAMDTLGSRYSARVVEFRRIHSEKTKKSLGA